MSKDSVIAYWIEADTGEFCSKSMGANDIFQGGTYESEVILKLARNPLDILVIPIACLGNDGSLAAIEQLKGKSVALRASANAPSSP